MIRNSFIAILLICFVFFFTKPLLHHSSWQFTTASKQAVTDPILARQIFQALTAAENAGTDPSMSHYKVRVATIIKKDGQEHTVLGGNSEYDVPEAIHGETSLINHVINLYGADTARNQLHFIAFFAEHCGNSGSCGDCRDYQKASTDYGNLLVVCGQSSDHTVSVTRFNDQLVDEAQFPAINPSTSPITKSELTRLLKTAQQAEQGGISLFNLQGHTAAALLTYSGKIYRAASADDAAFHYRYPIGGALQQAATERDYFIKAIVVVSEKGQWPIISYRDRQYGYESSSFNRQAGKPPIVLIISDGLGHYRATTFDKSLPNAFSTSSFKPKAVKDFLTLKAQTPND